jgi:hypothetical protein
MKNDQGFIFLLTFEEVLLEAVVAHVLVHQHAVVVLVAVADELDEVLVPQLAEEEHLGDPLAVPLRAAVEVEVLDGDGLRVEAGPEPGVHAALVHGPEPAAAEVVGAGEAAGDGPQLGVGEGVQVGPGQREGEVLWGERPRRAEAGEGDPRGGRRGRRRQEAFPVPPGPPPPPRRRRRRVVVPGHGPAGHAAEQRLPRRRRTHRCNLAVDRQLLEL